MAKAKPTRQKVVFVMGPGHCGSTLLDLILGSHSQAFSLGEFYRIQQSIDSQPTSNPAICGVCGAGFCKFWNGRVSPIWLKIYYSRASKVHRALGRVARHIYNPYRFLMKWSECDVLVDSSKNLSWIAKQLQASYSWIGIKPYLIYMGRDGRAVANSYLRKYTESDMKRAAADWRDKVEAMNAFYDSLPEEQRMLVRYEQLSTNSKAIMRSVCSWLGLDFEPQMLRYWEHDHHHIYGNGGTRTLIYRFREQSRGLTPAERQNAERVKSVKRQTGGEHYEQMEVAIKLDERWRRELSTQDLAKFESVAGKTNRPFAHD